MKLRSTGRGTKFSAARGVWESVQEVVYAAGWPGRVLDRLPAATRVAAVRHELELARGSVGRPPLKVAFVSDLHIGPLTPPRLLDRAFDQLDDFAADVLALGGDYVYLEATSKMAERLRGLVARVSAPIKVAVLGNHDLWTDNTLLERALADAGATVLVNDALRLPPPHDDVALIGIDEPWTGAPDAARAFAAAGDVPVRIVVAHAPEAFPHVVGRGAKLMLCGHTHGGQVALPSGPVVVHGPLGRRWPSGLHDVSGMKLFVSRGLGNVDLPIRANAAPDVSLFSIRSI
ncbi:MAG TPA: metallophosphoesterase [Polyangia bacterium]|nr:metallophosphoesterase [Polyangia bacterium]